MFRFRAPGSSPVPASRGAGFPVLVRGFHRWCGLTVGLLLLVVALTGAGMAFRWQLEPSLDADLLRVPACTAPLPPSRLVSAAFGANPHAGALSAIRMYADPNASTRVRFGDGRWVYVDPCSGRVLGIQDAYGGFFGTLAWVHIFGYLSFGATVAGSIALAAMAFIIAGLWLWWRSRNHHRPRSALSAGARHLQWHRSIGPWCAPVLLLLTLTGVPQAFPTLSDALQSSGRPASGPATPPAPAPLAVSARPAASARSAALAPGADAIDAAWRHATAMPWQQIQWRVAPGVPGQPIKAEITAADAPHAYAAGLASYDSASGALQSYAPYNEAATGRKAWLWALALHYGAVGGPAWPLILFLSALSVPVLAWTGVTSYLHRRKRPRPAATLNLRLARKQMEASNVCSFEFVHPQGRKLPPWTPGAHLDIHIAPGLIRQYSLCGDPHDRRRYLIAVHRCSPSRGGSEAMHDNLHENDLVQIGTPRNHFPLAHAQHTVLLAGGIGITPLLAMAEALAAADASFELHYCARSPAEAAFLDRLREERFAGRVQLHFSQGGQRTNMDTLLSAPQEGARLYICGSGTFTDAALAAAERQGWPAEAVSTERFAPTASASDGADAAPRHAFDLLIASTGRVVHVPAGQSALEALRAAGIDIPTSCGQGVCGTCITGVLEGEPDHRDQCLSPQARAANECFTPCCSRARSSQLVLDL